VPRAAFILTFVWALAHAAAAAGQASAPAVAPAPPSEVRAWLLRIHDAASRRSRYHDVRPTIQPCTFRPSPQLRVEHVRRDPPDFDSTHVTSRA